MATPVAGLGVGLCPQGHGDCSANCNWCSCLACFCSELLSLSCAITYIMLPGSPRAQLLWIPLFSFPHDYFFCSSHRDIASQLLFTCTMTDLPVGSFWRIGCSFVPSTECELNLGHRLSESYLLIVKLPANHDYPREELALPLSMEVSSICKAKEKYVNESQRACSICQSGWAYSFLLLWSEVIQCRIS